jgi:uncharacterized membrane protein YphA (DoxX/SURF4 family)
MYLLRIFLAILFLVSGFLKGIDPYGTSLKIQEYLSVYGLERFGSYSDALAVSLIGLELFTGLLLLLLPKTRWPLFSAFAILTFFTILMAVSSVISKLSVPECGCFGELLPMTPRESLVKNLVILAMTLICLKKNATDKHKPDAGNGIWLLLAVVISLGIPIYNTVNLPVIDLGGYRIGTFLQDRKEFRILNAEFKDVTPDFYAETQTLIVQKKPFAPREWDSIDTIKWKRNLGNGGISIISHGEFEDIPGILRYSCSESLLRSIARSSGNALITLRDGKIERKSALSQIR